MLGEATAIIKYVDFERYLHLTGMNILPSVLKSNKFEERILCLLKRR